MFGYFNILSASSGVEFSSYFDISKPFGKQLVFIGLSLILIFFILAIEAKFYERFAELFNYFFFKINPVVNETPNKIMSAP